MPSVTVNRLSVTAPSRRGVADGAASRLEAVEQQLDNTLERMVWRRRSARAQQPGPTAGPSRRRRAAAAAQPRLSLVAGSIRP
jgi:hypothetical protein